MEGEANGAGRQELAAPLGVTVRRGYQPGDSGRVRTSPGKPPLPKALPCQPYGISWKQTHFDHLLQARGPEAQRPQLPLFLSVLK